MVVERLDRGRRQRDGGRRGAQLADVDCSHAGGAGRERGIRVAWRRRTRGGVDGGEGRAQLGQETKTSASRRRLAQLDGDDKRLACRGLARNGRIG